MREFLDEVRSGAWKIEPPQSVMVQAALQYAVELLHPLLAARPLRLLEFDKPELLTSDAAVGLWAPDSEAPRSAGVVNARAIFMPLDRRRALTFMSRT